MDETYLLVGGRWKYLYRAVDKLSQTVDFLLTVHRDLAAARRFLERAIDLHDVPEKITIDKSGAKTAAARGIIADSGATVELRQSKYVNNLVEQDHRAIKRRVRPVMGFKEFHSAARLIAGIETMRTINNGQLRCATGLVVSDADRLYSLDTRWPTPQPAFLRRAALIATEPECVISQTIQISDRSRGRRQP